MIKKFFSSILFAILVVANASAQTPENFTDSMYSSGKIYVVVAVIAVIFVSLVIYLFMLDKRIGKMEKEIEKK